VLAVVSFPSAQKLAKLRDMIFALSWRYAAHIVINSSGKQVIIEKGYAF